MRCRQAPVQILGRCTTKLIRSSMLIGAGRLSHGTKGRSEYNPGRFVSNSFHRCSKSSFQITIQIMNILRVLVLFAIFLKCVVASGDDVGVRFKEAVDKEDFEWLNENFERWERRKDLLDDVIAKGAGVTVWLIQKVESAKRCVLAALFDKGEGMIDGVLEGIEYEDDDLYNLTSFRPELAGSPEKFFNVLGKIKKPWNQDEAVRGGVSSLFAAMSPDLVVPLVNALGEEKFKSDRLKEEAIRWAFFEGARRGNRGIVELYCEHPAITSERYVSGLYWSWKDGKPNQVFQFLLEQADQGDLDKAKEPGYLMNFYHTIDTTPKPAPCAGSRHSRFSEKIKLLKKKKKKKSHRIW